MTRLRVQLDAGLMRIVLADPGRHNALDLEQATELADVTRQCVADPSVRAVLLSSEGRFFHVGGDLAGLAAAERPAETVLAWTAQVHSAIARLHRGRAPVVVAVQGPAAGIGLSLALCGDVVLAAQSARFTSAYTAAGLAPDGGLSWLLPRLVGLRRAQELLLMNRTLDADTAREWGLVTAVHPDDELAGIAEQAALGLAAGPTGAFARTRDLLRLSDAAGLDEQLENEAQAIAACAESADGREGVRAFLDRRPPSFQG